MYVEVGHDALHVHSTSFLEGKVYRIKQFQVCDKKSTYMPMDSAFMIQVLAESAIEECPSPPTNIPLYTYRFTKFLHLSHVVREIKAFVGTVSFSTPPYVI